MKQNFEFPEKRPISDLQIVAQVGAVNLRLAYSTGVIDGDIESAEGEFNGIDEPSSIMGRPDDIFAAHRAASAFSAAATASGSAPAGPPEE